MKPIEYPKDEVLAVLRRVGVPAETLEEVERTLPDRIDQTTIGNLLGPYGITHDAIISWMGGSP